MTDELLNGKTQPNGRVDFQTLIGHVNNAEYPEDLTPQPESFKITPQQRSYVALRVRGFSNAAACRQLSISILGGTRWQQSPWFEPVCEEERNKWFISAGIDKKAEMMAPLMGAALDTLKSALHAEDEKVRMAAVNLIFETYFDAKRPVGRPRKDKDPENENVIDLSDIQQRARSRINDLLATPNGHIDLRANA